ncbi:polysaccharide biosynthesis tyrosine autokinase [Prosthecochloris vibrioformis]|uniref:non-specific protein-tyrosine kinase n=1 Tax=Prosthecochloris vibrioformis TaxID=1098 RepID=A0A5C4S1T9_PROVB|nr:polysaccharide biosynthesis tyrosine autokinase [Prosthecochloris vibrioformis]TNJ37424.1 polysaccharide biosynthesis tyrosine autokinase [Prosthecochloris vibrioformis]
MSQQQDQFEQEIDIKDLLFTLWHNRLIIAAVSLLVMVLVLFYHFSAVPEYRSSSLVLIKESKSSPAELINPFESMTGFQLQNDIELIKSFPLAEDVVRTLYADTERDSLEIFGERTYVSPVGVMFGFLDGFSLLPQKQKEPVPFDVQMRGYASRLQQRVSVSNTRDTDILQVSVSSPFADEAALLTNAICQAYMQKDIEWNADQAMMVKDFVNEQLQVQEKEIAAVEAKLSNYMKQQNIYELTGNAQNLLDKLVEAESRYNDARAEYNILQNRQEFLVQKLSREEREISAQIARNVDRQSSELKKRIKEEEMALIAMEREGQGATEAYAVRKQQLDLLRRRLEEATGNIIAGELAFMSKARQYQFDLISEQLQTDVRLAELSYIADEYLKSKNYYESQLNRLPQKQLNYARLQRDREVLNNTYTFLREKLEESRIKIASEAGKVVIVGAGYPPLSPVAPDLKKNVLIGLILGLGLGGALVFVREMLDNSLRDNEFLEQHGYVPLAFIPFIADKARGMQRKQSGKKAKRVGGLIEKLLVQLSPKKEHERLALHTQATADEPLLMNNSLDAGFSESFRDLRTNITFSRADNPLKTIMVSGTEMSEGKSTVAGNLGLAFALTGKRVLLLDCDLRRPILHRVFKVDRGPGLTDYLAGQQDDLKRLTRQVQHENLHLIPAGAKTPNPNELLGSQKMKELIRQLEAEWDIVILDTPPLLMLSDATVLSRHVDGILMVARMGYTNKNLLRDVQKTEHIRKNILGVAIVGPSVQDKYNYKYGRYYGRYSYKGYYSRESYQKYLDTSST